MVQVNSLQAKSIAAVYTPPKLPDHLFNIFNLKPVVGAPTDEEVKLIHSAMRAVENASHHPALFNPALSTDLANHLFEVQMARYKSKYPFPIFSDITYTPPKLPPHMKTSLEPVIVAPSDDQIRSVQAAFRFAEGMASVPSMYDADLSMQLSQHLFDLQLARYIQRTNEGSYATRDASARAEPNEEPIMDSRDPVEPIPNNEFTGIPEAHRRESVVGSEHEDGHNPKPSRRDSLNEPSSFAASLTDINDGIEQLKANQDQTNQRLDEMQDRLKDGLEQAFGRVVEKVTGLIVELQNQPTQGANSSSDRAYHHIVNEDEEASSPDSLTMSKRVDTFNTSQIRAWNRPQLKNSMEVIEAVHFNGCPIGLNCLDFNNKANLRIKAHIDGLNIDPNSMITKATVHLNAYADTVLYSAGCTWLDVGKQDRDFQFGEYLTGQWTENANESSIQVRFDKPYASVPRVLVWLKHIDASHTANCRISAQASDITATGFTLNVWTWADTIMYRATAVWIAHSSTRSNVTSGNFNTMDIRSWDMPQLENGAFITFDKEFERPPRVLVALNSLDVSNHTNLRIKAITKNVTTKGMKINIDSWHDTVLYSAGASWLAIQDY